MNLKISTFQKQIVKKDKMKCVFIKIKKKY